MQLTAQCTIFSYSTYINFIVYFAKVQQCIVLWLFCRRGSCISQLSISSLKKGLYGRHIATFARSVESNIPSNVFSSGALYLVTEKCFLSDLDCWYLYCALYNFSGDIVMVYRGLDIDFSFTGVVTHVSNEKISVVFDGGDKRRLLKKMDGVEEVSLVKAVNDITYRCLSWDCFANCFAIVLEVRLS